MKSLIEQILEEAKELGEARAKAEFQYNGKVLPGDLLEARYDLSERFYMALCVNSAPMLVAAVEMLAERVKRAEDALIECARGLPIARWDGKKATTELLATPATENAHRALEAAQADEEQFKKNWGLK